MILLGTKLAFSKCLFHLICFIQQGQKDGDLEHRKNVRLRSAPSTGQTRPLGWRPSPASRGLATLSEVQRETWEEGCAIAGILASGPWLVSKGPLGSLGIALVAGKNRGGWKDGRTSSSIHASRWSGAPWPLSWRAWACSACGAGLFLHAPGPPSPPPAPPKSCRLAFFSPTLLALVPLILPPAFPAPRLWQLLVFARYRRCLLERGQDRIPESAQNIWIPRLLVGNVKTTVYFSSALCAHRALLTTSCNSPNNLQRITVII